MNGRHRQFLIFITVTGVLSGLLLALLLPSLISALPGQVRGRLPEEVLRAISTPLPTALPAPIEVSAATPIPVVQLLASSTATGEIPPAASKTAAPTATESQPSAAPATPRVTKAAAVISSTPSPTASPTATYTATATATPIPTAPPPEKAHITGLTVVPQKFNNCGPANMSVMLDYYGLTISQLDIAAHLKPHYDDRNVSPEELVAYVNEETALQAAVFRGGDIDLLRRLLEAGYPVIVEKGYEPDAWQGWMGHYLTLFGYDDAEEQFLSLDTYLGPWDSSGRPIAYEELAFRWSQFNETFILVYRPFEEAAINEIVGPTYLDRARMWQHVAMKAEAAAAEQPDDAFAWFNLGAGLTELGKLNEDAALYNAAAAAFDQSRVVGLPPRMLWYQFQPYEAYIRSGRADEALALAAAVMSSDGGRHVEESHYYQGMANQAVGNLDLARAGYKRALAIKPGYDEAQMALDGLK